MGNRMYRRKRQEPIGEPPINITPLIDVVFVILIAFIVIAPLIELDRIELAQGGSAPSHVPVFFEDEGPIQVKVLRDNTILINNTPVTARALSKLLQDYKSRYPQARPQLFHDKKAHFGTYQDIKNSFESAGFTEIDIVLLP